MLDGVVIAMPFRVAMWSVLVGLASLLMAGCGPGNYYTSVDAAWKTISSDGDDAALFCPAAPGSCRSTLSHEVHDAQILGQQLLASPPKEVVAAMDRAQASLRSLTAADGDILAHLNDPDSLAQDQRELAASMARSDLGSAVLVIDRNESTVDAFLNDPLVYWVSVALLVLFALGVIASIAGHQVDQPASIAVEPNPPSAAQQLPLPGFGSEDVVTQIAHSLRNLEGILVEVAGSRRSMGSIFEVYGRRLSYVAGGVLAVIAVVKLLTGH